MAVGDYSATPDSNGTIGGVNIAEGCPASGLNNAIRQIMADIRIWTDAYEAPPIEFPVSIVHGGTGATDASAALTALGGLAAAYIGLPQVVQTADFTIRETYQGKHVYYTGAAANAVVAAQALFPMPVGSRVKIVNNGSGALSIRQTTAYSPNSVIKWAPSGTVGDRSLAVAGVADLLKVESDLWFISGSGLS